MNNRMQQKPKNKHLWLFIFSTLTNNPKKSEYHRHTKQKEEKGKYLEWLFPILVSVKIITISCCIINFLTTNIWEYHQIEQAPLLFGILNPIKPFQIKINLYNLKGADFQLIFSVKIMNILDNHCLINYHINIKIWKQRDPF